MADGLLDQPFDYSQAFDRALKNIVKTLGNRPAFETAEETVGHSKVRLQENGN
jgi:DNA replication licensing factor MCM3